MNFYNYEVKLEREFIANLKVLKVSIYTNGKVWAISPTDMDRGKNNPEEVIRQWYGRYGILSIRRMKWSE